jgi:NADH-quinone oxidoreductase subunit J
LDGLASPILLYTACVLGALGIGLAMPRRGFSPQIIGALIAALGLGVLMVGLGVKSPGGLPNFNFYLFSLIALGSAVRVITHPRPVYAALYFVLTIVASSGLYVLLSAEFMAFALMIVYAGAILITYLFVLMLATESPTADQVEALSDYDRYSREPALASVTGFVLIAAMTAMMFTGLGASTMPVRTVYADAARLELLPKKIETALRESRLIEADETIARDPASGEYLINLYPDPGQDAATHVPGVTIAYGQGQTRVVGPSTPGWPKDLVLSNVEGVGFALLADHPGAIEIAGVVLLMAMLGAVVLARKKVELDEREKLAAQARSLAGEFSPENSTLRGPESTGGTTTRSAPTRSLGEAAAGGAVGAGGGR